MAETILEFGRPVIAADGTSYRAKACSSQVTDGRWQVWIEFEPRSGGRPVRGPRETTQPKLSDAECWATGLTPTYLEGALERALNPTTIASATVTPPDFNEPRGPRRFRGSRRRT
jgi:hypothetical protein